MPQDAEDTGPGQKTEWAEDRTDWAEDRTILANERTFAGWMRTGMACLALAVGLKTLFGETDAGFYPARVAASVFVLVALYIFWEARARATRTVSRLNDHIAKPLKTSSVTIISALLGLGALGTGALLWII